MLFFLESGADLGRDGEGDLKSIWPRYVIGSGFGEVILLDECIKALHDGQSRLQDGGEVELLVRDAEELLQFFLVWSLLIEQVTSKVGDLGGVATLEDEESLL